MKSYFRTAGFASLIALCFLLVACKSDPFIGTWKPAQTGDNDAMKIESLTFKKDGTFSLKYKDSTRKEINGTFVKTGDKGDKIELTDPDMKSDMKSKLEGTIESDGRLKIGEGTRGVVFFVKG